MGFNFFQIIMLRKMIRLKIYEKKILHLILMLLKYQLLLESMEQNMVMFLEKKRCLMKL